VYRIGIRSFRRMNDRFDQIRPRSCFRFGREILVWICSSFFTMQHDATLVLIANDQGVFPSFEGDPKKIMMDYRRRIEIYTVENVVREALANTATHNFQPQTVSPQAYERYLLFARTKRMEIKMIETLWDMTEFLALTIAGATHETVLLKLKHGK
jgi:hypothetical protein